MIYMATWLILVIIGAANGASVVDEDGFVLIERHLDVANGYFSADVLTTGLENEDDPSANTYCIIGGLDSSDYLQSDGHYDLKLIYKYSDGTEDVLEWTQTSWITEATITGADLSNIVDSKADDNSRRFRGLALSPSSSTYLDGNGAEHNYWWHAVATTKAFKGGIPGHEKTVAYSSSLWIRPDIPSCSGPVSVDDIVFTPSGMSWGAANDWCIAQGMELVSIHDEDSQNAVYEACKTGWSEGTSFSRVWFGLNAIDQSFSVDNFMWSDGSDVDYTNWRDGHPRIDEECIMMYCGGGGSQGTWASHECSWHQPYGVCRRCSGDLSTMAPSLAPSLAPTLAPSPAPSKAPSPAPSVAPSLAPSTGPAYEEVYSHPGAIQPEQNVPLMYIDIVEEMHFEMDITVHSLLTHYKKFFQCTDGGDYTKVPYIVTHGDGQIMPRWTTADSTWGYDSPKKGTVAGETYHLEMDMAPGSWTVTLDGVVVYDRTELGDPLTLENIPCYIFSNSINGQQAADVTVSNLFIGVPEGPSYHYIAPGDYINDWNDHPESEWAICQEDSSNQAPVSGYFGYDIAVGCCEVDSSKGVRPDCDAIAKTYDEAVQICEENGHRLCTLDEMLWQRRTNDKGCHFDRAYNWVSTECVPTDPSLNAAAHSMAVEGDNGAEHDAVQKPVDDMNPIALTLIGAVVVVVIALLFVMMRGRTKKEQTAKETVAEMSEVVDAPKVVHVADDTVEVTTEIAVAEPSIPETTVNGMEEAVEVKVNTESV